MMEIGVHRRRKRDGRCCEVDCFSAVTKEHFWQLPRSLASNRASQSSLCPE